MRRRALIALTVCAPLAVPIASQAQPVGGFTLGYLDQGSKSRMRDPTHALAVLLANLRELGYVEGRNLTVESRFAEERMENLSALARQLVETHPQLIAVRSAGLAEAVLQHTKSVPVVALSAGQLEAEPGVESLARPGGNLTGMQIHSSAMIGKRLQLLQDVVPGLRRVAVLRGVPFEGPGFDLYRNANEAAAAALGIRARYLQFKTAADLGPLFEEMIRERDQAVLVWGNPHLNAHRSQIASLMLRYRLPAIYDVRYPGGPDELMIYGARIADVYREAAGYVDKILKGARPGDLPIGQAKTFDLVVNLKVAKAIGVTIPQSLLLRADEVIQ